MSRAGDTHCKGEDMQRDLVCENIMDRLYFDSLDVGLHANIILRQVSTLPTGNTKTSKS